MVKKKNTEKTKRKCLFQGQSTISKHWFDIDIQWVEENFSTRESQLYKRMFQINIEGQYRLTYPTFTVTIRNSKNTGEIEYNLKYPLVAYHQNASNSC